MQRNASRPDASPSGRPWSVVQIALAQISAPEMRLLPLVGVAYTSCRDGSVTPTTTIRPRRADALTVPFRTSTNE